MHQPQQPQQSQQSQPSHGTSVVPPFLHQSRAAAALVPCGCLVLVLGGELTFSTALLGSILAWTAYTLGFQAISLGLCWLTLMAMQTGIFGSCIYLLRQSILNLFLIFSIGVVLLLSGVWLSLQYSFVRQNNPFLCISMERILISLVFLPASVLLTWGAVILTGIDNAPYYFFIGLYANFCLFGLPLPSSFARGRSDLLVCGRIENAFHCACVLVLPSLFHIAIYHRALFSPLNLASLLLLVCIPVLSIFPLVDKGAFWWTGIEKQKLGRINNVSAIVCGLISLACVEYRVIFHSYSSSIQLRPPWSYIVVTAVLYSLATVIAAHFAGHLGVLGKARSLVLCTVAAFGLSLVVGLPWYLLPIPAAAAYFLVNFYFHNRMQDNLAFTVFSAVCLQWFMWQRYYFIDFSFDGVFTSTSSLAIVVLLMFILSSIIFGLEITRSNSSISGILLITQAVGLAALEQALYTNESSMYPGYLVLLTSISGTYLTLKLHEVDRITLNIAWCLVSLFLSKIALFLKPLPLAIPSALLLVLTISPLYYFYTSPRMSRQQGMVQVVAVGITAFVTRHKILGRLFFLWIQKEPSESSMFAMFLLVWAIGCAPLAFRFYPHLPAVRNLDMAVLAIGTILLLIQPEMGFVSASDDHSIHLAQWLLFCTVTLSIMCISGIIPFARSRFIRTAYSFFNGVCIGFFITQTYFPPQTSWVLHLAYMSVFSLVSMFIIFSRWPGNSTTKMMPILYALLFSLFPVIFLLQNFQFGSILGSQGREIRSGCRMMLLAIYSAINILIAVEMKYGINVNTPSVKRSKGAQLPQLDWIPYIGNAATISGFLLLVILNVQYMNGSQTSIFFFAPILLLLNKDRYFFKDLNENNRYFPIIATSSLFLALNAVSKLMTFIFFMPSWSTSIEWTTISWIKNVILFLITIPLQYSFNQFVWNFQRKSSGTFWVFIIPLNLLPALFANVQSIQILGLLGLIEGVLQLLIFQRIQKAGKEIL